MRAGPAFVLALVLPAGPALGAHEGGSMRLHTCVETAGPRDAYWARLEAFQEGQRHCQAIPEPAPADIVLDLKGRLKTEPLTVRVERTDGTNAEGALLALPERRYASGVVEIDAPFRTAGHYRLVLEAIPSETRLEFPLAVGIAPSLGTQLVSWGVTFMTKPNVLILFFLALFSLVAVWRFVRVPPQTSTR